MPYVNVVLAGKITQEQRREIAKDISESLVRVAGKKKESVYISFSEYERDEFAKGENLLSDMDKMEQKQKS